MNSTITSLRDAAAFEAFKTKYAVSEHHIWLDGFDQGVACAIKIAEEILVDGMLQAECSDWDTAKEILNSTIAKWQEETK